MIKIGVTGGIGSGKSTVCKYFEELGISVYYSDFQARRIMETDKSVISSIITEFGEKSYSNDKLNKDYLASIVFGNNQLISKLNKIVHPAVINDFIGWSEIQEGDYVILESALIFESGINSILQKVICVTASDEEKAERIFKRDGLSKEEIYKRIKSQMPDSEKSKFADYVIISGDKNQMKERVLAIHQEFCKTLKISHL